MSSVANSCAPQRRDDSGADAKHDAMPATLLRVSCRMDIPGCNSATCSCPCSADPAIATSWTPLPSMSLTAARLDPKPAFGASASSGTICWKMGTYTGLKVMRTRYTAPPLVPCGADTAMSQGSVEEVEQEGESRVMLEPNPASFCVFEHHTMVFSNHRGSRQKSARLTTAERCNATEHALSLQGLERR